MKFDFIMVVPLLLSCCSFLSLDMGYLFLVGSSILLSMIIQQLFVTLELLQEEMNACSFLTLPCCTGLLYFTIAINWKFFELILYHKQFKEALGFKQCQVSSSI